MAENMETNEKGLPMPFFELFENLDQIDHGWQSFFETSTLIFSIQRLFGFYFRIINSLDSRESNNLLEADIESFIIRVRLILNDIAYLIRQLLPENVQGLKGPKGAVHPKNKELSMNKLISYFTSNPDAFPEIGSAITKNTDWIEQIIKQRDGIIHYKSRVYVWDDDTFTIFDAARDNRYLDDLGKVKKTPIFDYVNNQVMSIYKFMNGDIREAILKYLKSQSKEYNPMFTQCMMTSIGMELFKTKNEL